MQPNASKSTSNSSPARILWHMAQLTAHGLKTHTVTLISPDEFCWLLADLLQAELEHRKFPTEVTKWTTPDIAAADDDEEMPF